MHTHKLYTLNQPPAGFLCRHLEHRPGLRTQTSHLHLHHQPTSPSIHSDDQQNLLPVKIPQSGPHESNSHLRNETLFYVFPLSKKKQSKDRIRPDLPRSGLRGGGGDRASLSTGRHGCANKRAGYLSPHTEALGFSLETSLGTGPTSWALLLGLHSPDKLI